MDEFTTEEDEVLEMFFERLDAMVAVPCELEIFSTLFADDDTYDETDGTRQVDMAAWSVTSECLSDRNAVDEGSSSVITALFAVEETADYLMKDTANGVDVFLTSAWLPASADCDVWSGIYIYGGYETPTAEYET